MFLSLEKFPGTENCRRLSGGQQTVSPRKASGWKGGSLPGLIMNFRKILGRPQPLGHAKRWVFLRKLAEAANLGRIHGMGGRGGTVNAHFTEVGWWWTNDNTKKLFTKNDTKNILPRDTNLFFTGKRCPNLFTEYKKITKTIQFLLPKHRKKMAIPKTQKFTKTNFGIW